MASGDGGGIYCGNNAAPVISKCIITDNETPDNSGGGVFNNASSPTLNGCTIEGNYAYVKGGGVYNENGSAPKLVSCVIAGNRAVTDGGGLYDDNSDSTLVNCTVTANAGGGLCSANVSDTTIRNCIFWENRIDTTAQKIEIKVLDTSHADISYCDVEGGEAGINAIKDGTATVTFGTPGATWAEGGNIDLDPMFVTSGYWEEASTPGTLTLEATVRDFVVAGEEQYYTDGSAHRDFEYNVSGLEEDIVKDVLGSDRKPEWNDLRELPADSSVHTEAEFDQWYNNASGINKEASIDIELTYNAVTEVYEFSDEYFFPIDDGETFEGDTFGNTVIDGTPQLGDDLQPHNFHFTLELHHKFEYSGGETFSFRGDDDLFVFIDKQLEIDLGGVHGPLPASVNLDTDCDLTVGGI